MCEMACSVNKYRIFSSRRSRIWIETDARVGKDIAHVCQQNIKACRARGEDLPQCIAACPAAGETDPPIFWDGSTSMVMLIPRESCMDCLACMKACRFQAIRLDTVDRTLIKCHLCKGDPQCITICVTDAIQHEGGDKAKGEGAVSPSSETGGH